MGTDVVLGICDNPRGDYPHTEYSGYGECVNWRPIAAVPTKKAEFNSASDVTLDQTRSVYNQRGGEYQDTWDLANQVTTMLDHVLRSIGRAEFTPQEKRLIVAAALCDVKDSRLIGGYKKDTHLDAIAYRAALAHWLEEYMTEGAPKSAAPVGGGGGEGRPQPSGS
jgi:hypothetical protein